jgi:hypothetical protein
MIGTALILVLASEVRADLDALIRLDGTVSV